MISYSEKIKHFRQKKKLSQYDLARELQIEQPQYWRYENGKTELPLRYLIEICKILEVTPNDIIWEEKIEEIKNESI